MSAPMKSLRETASSSGRPSSCRRSSSRSSCDRLRGGLGEVRARVEHQLLGRHAALQRELDARAKKREHLGRDIAVEARGPGGAGVGAARVCITTSAAPVCGADVGRARDRAGR